MSVFGSIFGKNKLGKGSHGVAMFFTAGARGMRPGRSGSFPSITPSARRISARPVTEHNIGGSHPRALSPRRWEMPSGMYLQAGRTLLEMLAVLAIVGVLSIAGLAGFTYAMNKIRANDTMRDVNLWALRATETEQTYPVGQTISTDDIGYKSTHGYDIAAVAAGNNLFAVELVGLSDKVCKLLLEMAASSYVVEATHDGMGNGVQFDGNDTSVCTNEPTLYFYFDSNMNKPTDVCLPACGVGETCCNNGCYPTDGLCGSLCACPSGTQFGKNGMIYYGCIGTQSPIIACYPSSGNYVCYKDWTQCGTTCTDYTGAGCPDCQVDETVDCPDGTQYQPTTGLCASPDSTTGCVENNGSWECVTCATGSSYGDLGNGRYGCINDNGTKCYADGDSFTCLKDGVICGTGCAQTGTGGTCDAGCG